MLMGQGMTPDEWRNMPSGSWKTSSGLLDDYDHVWEEVWFGTDDRFGGGKTVLLNVRGPAYQEGEMVDEEVHNLYSCGDGWKVAKGGEETTHPTRNGVFTAQSNMGRLIDAVLELGDDVIEEISSRGDTFQAETWRGLKFHIERKTFHYKDRETGEDRSYEVPLPTEYLGVGGEEEDKPKGSAKSKGKSSGTRRRKKTKDLRDEVVEFASEFEDHGDFLDAVFDADEFERADEVQEDEELSNEVLDPDSELWAESREED